MNDQLLQRKAEALARAVQAGDHASALGLLGEVAAEAERRGIARCAAAARRHADAAHPGLENMAKLAALFDGWAGTTQPPGEPVATITTPGFGPHLGPPAGYEPAAEEAPPPEGGAVPEEGAEPEAPDADEEAPAEEEGHPKRRRKK